MAHTLHINYNNGTILQLTTAPWYTLQYEPNSPSVAPLIESNEMEDGEEILRSTLRNVEEPAVFMLKPTAGNNMSQCQAQIQLLEMILSQAFSYQENGNGYRTYLIFGAESGSNARSELLGGRVEIDGGDNARNWAVADAVIVRVTFYRRFYWEADEVNLNLVNSGGSGSTVTVYNRDEVTAGYDNYFTISTTIAGVISAPLILRLTDNYATGESRKFYIGLSAFADTGFTQLLDSSVGYGTGTTDSDTVWNNGEAFIKVMPTSEGQIMYWQISGTNLAKYGGRYYRVFARTGKTIQTDHYIRFRLSYPQGAFTSVLADTGEIHVESTKELQDLGVIQLPPNLVNESDLAAVSLELMGYSETAAQNFYLDYILLMPAESFVVATGINYGLTKGGAAGQFLYTSSIGVGVSPPYPGGEAESADPLVGEFTIKCKSVTKSTV